MSKKPRPKLKSRKPDAEKVAAKRARRAERQQREAEIRAQKTREAKRRRIGYAGIGVVGFALVALFVFIEVKPGSEIDGVERPPFQRSRHVAPGQTVNYATATPTSGPHGPSSARCGLQASGVPLEFAVHNLEHGAVVVWYRPDLEESLLPGLQTSISQWDSHVLVAPNPGISEQPPPKVEPRATVAISNAIVRFI